MELIVHHSRIPDLVKSLMSLNGVVLNFRPWLGHDDYVCMKLHRSQAKKLKRMISDDELQAHFQSEFYKHLDEEARKETINRITQNWLRFEKKNED